MLNTTAICLPGYKKGISSRSAEHGCGPVMTRALEPCWQDTAHVLCPAGLVTRDALAQCLQQFSHQRSAGGSDDLIRLSRRRRIRSH